MSDKKKKKEFVILFQGDSVTDAGRNLAKEFNQDLGLGYPYLISARLRCDHPEKNYRILNRGISGNRSVDLYARWKIDALNLKPDLISILIGVNDVWHELSRHSGVELDRFEKVYRLLLEETFIRLPGARILLCEPFILHGAATDADFAGFSAVEEYASVVARLAGEYKLGFVPLQRAFSSAAEKCGAETLLADGVHPTVQGSVLLAREWLRAFDAYLR